MISFLVIAAQIAGAIFGALNFWHNVAEPVQAARAGAVMATLDGFWWPVIRDAIVSTLSFATVWAAPNWKPILAFIRSLLPENNPATPGETLQKLIDDLQKDAVAKAKAEVAEKAAAALAATKEAL